MSSLAQALHEFHLEASFELVDLVGDRRLGDVQLLGG